MLTTRPRLSPTNSILNKKKNMNESNFSIFHFAIMKLFKIWWHFQKSLILKFFVNERVEIENAINFHTI